ncbi:MAG: hypothetical protein RLZZ44_1918, partial [Bacteroidota bacterium]
HYNDIETYVLHVYKFLSQINEKKANVTSNQSIKLEKN